MIKKAFILAMLTVVSACGGSGGSTSLPPTGTTPVTSAEKAQETVACPFYCSWNNGQKRVINTVTNPTLSQCYFQDGTTVQASDIPASYNVPSAGQTCPCTYDSSYDTTYTGGVDCTLVFKPS